MSNEQQQHTPGPWTIDRNGSTAFYINATFGLDRRQFPILRAGLAHVHSIEEFQEAEAIAKVEGKS